MYNLSVHLHPGKPCKTGAILSSKTNSLPATFCHQNPKFTRVLHHSLQPPESHALAIRITKESTISESSKPVKVCSWNPNMYDRFYTSILGGLMPGQSAKLLPSSYDEFSMGFKRLVGGQLLSCLYLSVTYQWDSRWREFLTENLWPRTAHVIPSRAQPSLGGDSTSAVMLPPMASTSCHFNSLYHLWISNKAIPPWGKRRDRKSVV